MRDAAYQVHHSAMCLFAMRQQRCKESRHAIHADEGNRVTLRYVA